MHPMWRQTRLREYCAEEKIHVSAYSPLGGPGNLWGSTAVVDSPILHSIALKHNATPAQVLSLQIYNTRRFHHSSVLTYISLLLILLLHL